MRRGFTLVEAAVALLIAGAVIGGGIIFASRKFVDDGDATKSVTAAGFTEAKVVARHNVLASRNGCSSSDDVAFAVLAKDVAGKAVNVTVCCGAWYKGCAVKTK